MHSYAHVLSFCLDHPWAITRPMLETIASVLARRVAGRELSAEDMQSAIANRRNLPQPTGGGGAVAIIPVHGVLFPRANMMTEMSGATSYDALTAMIREAAKTESVTNIVLDIDSPGGSVAGCTELAAEILKARKRKPITAVANYTMASAAYWLGACATEIVAAPSARVGSVGVFAIHDDLSKALEAEGINRTYITAGKHKADDNETQPLEGEAAARWQRMVNDALALFHGDVAKGRGVSIEDVRTKFGEGAVMTAEDARAAGMVDRIGTLDETVRRLASGEKPAMAAQNETPALVAGRKRDSVFRAIADYDLCELELSTRRK